jgi:hypothetical protein
MDNAMKEEEYISDNELDFDFIDDEEYLPQVFNTKKSDFSRNKRKKEKINRFYQSTFKMKQTERKKERISFHFTPKIINIQQPSVYVPTRMSEDEQFALAIQNSLFTSLNEYQFDQEIKQGNMSECGISLNVLKDLMTRELNSNDYETLLLLDEKVEKKTIHKNKIESFKERRISENENGNTCSICMDEYQVDDMVRILPCNHEFHKECIDFWLSEKSTKCPLDGIEL